MTGSLLVTRRSFAAGLFGGAVAVPLLSRDRQPLLMQARQLPASTFPPMLDHLVWLARDLDTACAKFESMTGIAPVHGGTHPSGTHNALVALGPACYLEIAAPKPGVIRGHPWIEATLERPEPHLHAYCMRAEESLEALASRFRAASIRTLGPSPGHRITPSGKELRWRLLIPLVPGSRGTVPFFIDWIEARHPSRDAPKGVLLTDFRVSHQHQSRMDPLLRILAPGVRLFSTDKPSLFAQLSSPRGKVVLTS